MKIWAKTTEFSEGKFLVVRRDGTIPHWPHFVLGARDPAAPAALRAYADEAARRNFEPEYVASVRELADDFERYLLAEGPGDPEAPPHRQDYAPVIRAMRGDAALLSVKRDDCNEPKLAARSHERSEGEPTERPGAVDPYTKGLTAGREEMRQRAATLSRTFFNRSDGYSRWKAGEEIAAAIDVMPLQAEGEDTPHG